mgnify:CR=1 FL=1
MKNLLTPYAELLCISVLFMKRDTSLRILGESKAIYRIFCFHRGSRLRRILVLRFSGDITVKSPSVASKWQRIILLHAKWRIDGKADARLFHSGTIVYPSGAMDEIELLNAVRTLFGLSSIFSCFEVRTDFDEIVDAAHVLAGKIEGISLIPYKINFYALIQVYKDPLVSQRA